MSFTAPKPQVSRTLVPEGTHPARVIGFIHVGVVDDTYMGQPITTNKIRLTWEFPDETKVFKEGEDAKPLVHSQEYTFSMGKKSNLRPIVEGIIGTSLDEEEAYNFNFESMMGLPCLVSIKHGETKKGTPFAKVASTSKLMKGQVVKEAFNPLTFLTYENWNEAYFQSLPDFIKEKMMKSLEYKKMKGISEEVGEDDLNF